MITGENTRWVTAWMTLALMLLTIAAPLSAQTVRYIHTDALGSVVAVTDANRNVIERREYEPYGAQLTPAISDGPGYTGHVSDAATGLSYMQQRYYDPGIGRFLSVDPVTADGNTGSNFNRYWYANLNPYRFIDPDGRASDDPDRQPNGGINTRWESPGRDRVLYENGGFPTSSIASLWRNARSAQESLGLAKIAMSVYRIQGDSTMLSYEPNVEGATADPFEGVAVGPGAFESWSWLSATLGHEFEVHMVQFEQLGILQGPRDFHQREFEANKYNVDNARRFRNTPEHIQIYKDRIKTHSQYSGEK